MELLQQLGDKFTKGLVKIFGSSNERIIKQLHPTVEKINQLESELVKLPDKKLRQKTEEFKKRLEAKETLDDILPDAFAVTREAARRILGMRHYDVQMIGGIVLHQGKIAEMITGEGKTLVATCPAYLNALTGKSVFIITVNDYLARRDGQWMGPIFEFLGLTVGCIQSDMDPYNRKEEYNCNIVYGTNNEFGFDYLRDNMKMSLKDQCQSNLYYAIIDEVDSALIDEARTPLIISGPAEESTDKYYEASKIVKKLSEGEHFELKEKEQLAILTEEGIERAEKLAGVDSFYKGKNMDWPHHITQALRALHFYKNDREYVVKDGEIIIVDESTGRLQPGRRWTDGLHQAIEAKERLKIREENQTLATITFQNYFRLFDKISGMTGTAMTEAMEFDKIYKLEVVAIPPNRPLIRKSYNDIIYATEAEKFQAIAWEIIKYHRIGRPMLIGTISIEKSEQLSKILQLRQIPHQVLNAKHHEREANIIAKAGQLGAVTIATNMAGRGTDITLGTFTKQELLSHWQQHGLAPKKLALDDPKIDEKLLRHWGKYYLKEEDNERSLDVLQRNLEEYWQEQNITSLRLCESAKDLGGLHILGTERHDSRRIDNQLRGRSGRQGDPGSSQYYLCFEDGLLRKFAPPRMVKLMQTMGMKEGQDLQHPMLNRGIEKAQKRVEGYHFEIRKSLLEYDEVMNEQRKLVYGERQEVLHGENLRDMVWRMINDRVLAALDMFLPDNSPSEWNREDLSQWLHGKFRIKKTAEELSGTYHEVKDKIFAAIEEEYQRKEKEFGEKQIRALERYILLDAIDSKWKDHLHAMDELKAGINMRAYGQLDPKIEYKREGYQLFDMMIEAIQEEVTELIFKVQIEEPDLMALQSIWNPSHFTHQTFAESQQSMPDPAPQRSAPSNEPQATSAPAVEHKTIRRDKGKVGRNDPCPCGSGKKFKKCHGK